MVLFLGNGIIIYLQQLGLEPVIIGTLASIKHLKISEDDIRNRLFRPAPFIELFVNKKPMHALNGWKIEERAEGLFWISPSGGYAVFRMPEDLSHLFTFFESLEKDSESLEMECPLASLSSVFKINLNSEYSNDLSEILTLVRRIGIPEGIEENLRTATQKKNFQMLKHWEKLRLKSN
jgi:hypothetical protein